MPSWVSLKDIALLGVIPAAALFAWSVPERLQERIARRLARLRQNLTGDRAAFVRLIESVGGREGFDEAPQHIVDAYFANLYLYNLFILQCHGPGGWHPETELEGQEHVDAALADKRGAILWLGDFAFADYPAYLTFHRSSYELRALSRYSHGLSQTELGLRLLNKIVWNARSRYYREVLIIGPDDRIGDRKPFEVLTERLRANQIFAIRAYGAGARTATISVLDGVAELATGPLALAQKTGAAVLPIWTVRRAGGAFKTTVEAPLDLHDGDPAVAIERSLAHYAALHERYVSAHPDQFHWHRVSARAPG